MWKTVRFVSFLQLHQLLHCMTLQKYEKQTHSEAAVRPIRHWTVQSFVSTTISDCDYTALLTRHAMYIEQVYYSRYLQAAKYKNKKKELFFSTMQLALGLTGPRGSS